MRQQEPGGNRDVLSLAAIILTAVFWPVGILLALISPTWSGRDKVVAVVLPLLGVGLMLALALPAPYPVEPLALGERIGWAIPQRVSSALGILLYLFGYLGAPLTAAAYLALSRIPRTRSAAETMLVVIGGLVSLGLLLVALGPTGPGLG